MENVIHQDPLLLGLRLPQVDNVVRGSGGDVQALPVDIDVGSRGQQTDGPDGRGSGRPRVAEDGLVIAVKETQVRGFGKLGELDGRLVKGSLDLIAVACR